MLVAGLGLLGFAARRRKQKAALCISALLKHRPRFGGVFVVQSNRSRIARTPGPHLSLGMVEANQRLLADVWRLVDPSPGSKLKLFPRCFAAFARFRQTRLPNLIVFLMNQFFAVFALQATNQEVSPGLILKMTHESEINYGSC